MIRFQLVGHVLIVWVGDVSFHIWLPRIEVHHVITSEMNMDEVIAEWNKHEWLPFNPTSDCSMEYNISHPIKDDGFPP